MLLLSRDSGTAGQGKFFVPGQRDGGTGKFFCPRTEEFVPGQDGPGQPVKIRDRSWDGTGYFFLSRDKGTAGRENFFVPGQRDNGTSRPLETNKHQHDSTATIKAQID